MTLNIKSEETYQLTRELARITGESLTLAVTNSVRERLERVRQKPEEDYVARVLAIGRDCASRLNEEWLTVDHGELLYDEKGLPK